MDFPLVRWSAGMRLDSHFSGKSLLFIRGANCMAGRGLLAFLRRRFLHRLGGFRAL